MSPVFGMTDSDKFILRALSDSGFALKPTTIRYNLSERYDFDMSESTWQRRRDRLMYAGLIELEDELTSHYAITKLGERYLDGDLTTEEEMEASERIQRGPPDDEENEDDEDDE